MTLPSKRILIFTGDGKGKTNVASMAGYLGYFGNEGAGFTSGAIEVRVSKTAKNTIELWVKDKEKLRELVAAQNAAVGTKGPTTDGKYTLKIGDTRSPDSRFRNNRNARQSFNVVVNLAKKAPAFSVSLAKQRLDITNPAGFQTATVKLSNVASELASVKLYEQRFSDAKRKVLSDLGNVESKDFEAVVTGALTFNIVRKPGALPAPNVAQKLSVEITLKNGVVLRSYAYDGSKAANKRWSDKPVSVNPQQPSFKAAASRSTVSLNRGAPLSGESVGLTIAPTAANPNVSIGAVGINPAKVKTLQDGGFRLEQNGEGEWTIYFANDKTPVVLTNKGVPSYKSGNLEAPKAKYPIELQVWPEGSFKWQTDPRQPDGFARDKSGNKIPVALTNPLNGKATSKPITVKMTVNVLP